MQLFKGQRTHPRFIHCSSKPNAPEPLVTFRAPLESLKLFFATVNDLFLSPTIFAAHCAYRGKVLLQCHFMNMEVMSLSFRSYKMINFWLKKQYSFVIFIPPYEQQDGHYWVWINK